MNTIQEPLKEEHTHTNTTKKSVPSVSSKTSVIQTKKYPAYKDSGVEWIGDIPEHWASKPFFTIGKVVSENNNQNGELLSVYLEKGVIKFSDVSEKRTNVTSEDLSKYQTVEHGYLVLNNQQAWRGSVGVSKYKGIVSPAYIVLKLSNKINSNFANYLFRDGAMVSNYLICSKGVGTIQRNLYWPQLKRANVCFPPIEEQTIIAKFLDDKTAKIEQAISIKQKQIELLKERRQILIHHAVTKGINPNVKLKDSGVEWIGVIPESWEVKKIKHITSKIGSGVTPSGGGTTYLESGIPLLRSQNILFGKIELEGVAFISDKIHASMSNSHVRKGDVLLNITGGSIGRCHYVDFDSELNVNQHVCILRPKKQITTLFLNSFLSSEIGQGQIWFNQQGGGREGLNFQSIKNFFLPLPPIFEQNIICDFIEHTTNKFAIAISLKEQEIEKLKEYKASLINSVVTGKVKVF